MLIANKLTTYMVYFADGTGRFGMVAVFPSGKVRSFVWSNVTGAGKYL